MFYRKFGAALEEFREVLGNLSAAAVGNFTIYDRELDNVEVYKWIVLALSISLDFWLRWLVHKA
jgi:hypothetical protein